MSDLIDRNDAVEAIEFEKVYVTAYKGNSNGYVSEGNPFTQYNKGLDDAIKAINNLAPVKPERKKGRWQRRKGSDCWECSQCHAVLENDDLGMHNFYFCYHCGANMMNKSGYMDIEEVHYG